MFNFPLEHRSSNKYLTPAGYNLFFAPRRRFIVDGTVISFKAPRYNWLQQKCKPEKIYRHYPLNVPIKLYSDQTPRLFHYDESNIDGYGVYGHNYGFFGPWFTGEQAKLHLSVWISRENKYSSSVSLFHPRTYEMMLAESLTYSYSQLDDCFDNIQQNLAPVDWTPLDNFPVNVARYKIVGQSPMSMKLAGAHELIIPIDHNVTVGFRFNLSAIRNYPPFITSRYVNMAPVNKLVEDIIASIRVKLSPRAQAAQKQALEGLDDTSLTKNFSPLKWDNLDDVAREKTLEKINKWFEEYHVIEEAEDS